MVRRTISGPPGAVPGRRPRVIVERVALATATTLVSINIWTGFPLLALWVGSRFVGGSGLSMSAVLIVIVALLMLMTAGGAALGWLSARYDRLTGRRPARHRTAPWLRSMSAERAEPAARSADTNAIERIVVITVVAAVIAFEVWFFFFAGSSLPKRG